ncbi:MAG TPA: hypothetical protein EYG92_12420 [Lutibacter sp.]|nr:hypothetical protein [Lutibacter sp.]
MSPFLKSTSLILGVIVILYLFTCSTYLTSEQTKNTFNHDQLVEYVLSEVDYELLYGDKNTNVGALIDKAILNALKEK